MRLNQFMAKGNKEKKLFLNGIKAFNEKKFYDAHEYLEDLWSQYYLSEALFIQGLIQLSVGYFHITNSNLKIEYKTQDNETIVKHRVGSPNKAMREINFKFEINLYEGLKDLINLKNDK